MIELSYILSQVLNGLVIGLIYSLMAIGLTMIFGVMRMISFFHSASYMVAGYVLYYVTISLGMNPIVGLFVATAMSGFFGVLFEYVLLQPMYTAGMEKPGEYAVIITFGAGIFLMNFIVLVAGPHVQRPPDFLQMPPLFGVVSSGRLLGAVIGLFIITGVLIFVRRTLLGKALQATSQNRDGAAIVGINTLNMNHLAFGISSALAGAAGALLAPTFLVSPDMGWIPNMKGLVIVILGGMGSIKGSLVGAIILGLVESLGSVLLGPQFTNIYSFVLLIVVLLIRPQGLFGEKERRM